MVGMPKNYGQGVGVDSWRAGGLRGLVRLGRIELWTRLDRNMLRPPDAAPATGHHHHVAVIIGMPTTWRSRMVEVPQADVA